MERVEQLGKALNDLASAIYKMHSSIDFKDMTPEMLNVLNKYTMAQYAFMALSDDVYSIHSWQYVHKEFKPIPKDGDIKCPWACGCDDRGKKAKIED